MVKRRTALEIDKIAADESKNEIERIAAAFGQATESFIVQCGRERELALAMGDEDTAVKERIKSNVMKSAREIFEYCYLNVTGERKGVWDE